MGSSDDATCEVHKRGYFEGDAARVAGWNPDTAKAEDCVAENLLGRVYGDRYQVFGLVLRGDRYWPCNFVDDQFDSLTAHLSFIVVAITNTYQAIAELRHETLCAGTSGFER
jgi:hypothetical protein